MTVTTCLLVLFLGLLIGTVSGMVGIGGGVLVIPLLMFIFGFSQAKANGTSLAMLLPPIGIFAVLTYSRDGNVDWPFAGLLGVGFVAGALLGARLVSAELIHPTVLRVGFASLLIYCAARMLFQSGFDLRSAWGAAVVAITVGCSYLAMKPLRRHRSRALTPRRSEHEAGRGRQEPAAFDYEI